MYACARTIGEVGRRFHLGEEDILSVHTGNAPNSIGDGGL